LTCSTYSGAGGYDNLYSPEINPVANNMKEHIEKNLTNSIQIISTILDQITILHTD